MFFLKHNLPGTRFACVWSFCSDEGYYCLVNHKTVLHLSKFVLAPCGNRQLMPVRFSFVSRLSLFRTWLCLSFAILFSFHAYAQPMVPDFTSTATSGCAPLVVNFKDITTGSPKFWNWDFGNGHLDTTLAPGSLSYTYNTGPDIDTFAIQMI